MCVCVTSPVVPFAKSLSEGKNLMVMRIQVEEKRALRGQGALTFHSLSLAEQYECVALLVTSFVRLSLSIFDSLSQLGSLCQSE